MIRRIDSRARRSSNLGLLAAFILAGVLVLSPSAPADLVKPLIALGPTTVLNGTAVVSGTIGVPSSTAELTVNGQPVSVDAAGRFAAIVNLGGASNLSFAVKTPGGETMTTSIPLTTNIVGPGGLIDPGVLSTLEQAAVTLLKPLDGFRITDGLPLRVEGSVLNKDSLSSLKVNGIDALSLLGPDGRYSLQLPGTTREVTVSVIDRQGVSQTTVTPVQHTTSPATTPAGAVVGAQDAIGVSIARIRYQLKGIRRTKRLRVIVTVKDRRGVLVRNASVSVRSAKVRWIARNPKAKRTAAAGQASFLLTARHRAFGKRLALVVLAKTPQAKARKATSVRLPRLAKPTAGRRR